MRHAQVEQGKPNLILGHSSATLLLLVKVFFAFKPEEICYRATNPESPSNFPGHGCELMFPEVDTKDTAAVCAEVQAIYCGLFPDAGPQFIRDAFGWIDDCFCGRHPEYHPIDAQYHDLEHTLQGTLCFARLLEGYKKAQADPPLDRRTFELGLLAILLHDTGYLKKREDVHGTGAKYTLVHVGRSAEFAGRLLAEKSFPPEDIRAVQNMIRCTGVNVDLASIPFQSELEKRIAFALGTADLLGQMAAADYIDKLATLYHEFEESNTYNGKVTGPGIFNSADDLRRRTPAFWEEYVLPRIQGDFLGVYNYLNQPYPDGPNPYVLRVQSNIARLEQQLGIAWT